MKVIVQRSKKSNVKVDDKITGEIDKGLVVLVGFTQDDTEKEIEYITNKIINLRVFNDENNIMNKGIQEINGSILLVSQFTLYADTQKGNRPSYSKALSSKEAIKLYEIFINKLKENNIKVETGLFGHDMELNITNDGPVTIIIEKNNETNCAK